MDYTQALSKIDELQKAIFEAQEKAKNLTDITKSLETHIFRVRKDNNGRYIIVFSEGQIAEKYQMTTADVKGKTISKVFGESLYQDMKAGYEKAFSGETAHLRGFLFRKRYFSTILTPFNIENDGTVTEISGITQDINELYDTEKKYKEMTEVLNNIIEYNPYSIQICDPEGYQIKHNNAFLKIFKSAPSKEWSLFNDALLKNSGHFDEILKVKQGEIVEIPEIWYNSHEVDPRYPDNLVCLRAIHFPIYNHKHELENIILMHEDITSKMSLRKRVRELEEFHELTTGRESMLKGMEEELEQLKLQLALKNSNN